MENQLKIVAQEAHLSEGEPAQVDSLVPIALMLLERWNMFILLPLPIEFLIGLDEFGACRFQGALERFFGFLEGCNPLLL